MRPTVRLEDVTLKPQDLGIGKLFERVRDAMIVADATTGRIVLWNPAATEIFGYSSSEALGMSVEDLVPSHLKERHRAGISRYRDTSHGPYIDSNTVLDLPAVRKTGEEIRVELTLSPIEPTLDSEAKGRFVLAILRDVTERKRAEEEVRRLNEQLEERVAQRTAELEAALAELRDSEERYRLLVEGAQDYAIFMLDPQGHVATWNEGAERLFGYQGEEIIGKPGSLLFVPEDIRSGAPEREREKATEEGRAVDDRWHVRKDGSQFWASGFVRPVRDEAGILRGFAKVARDITVHKKIEDKLRESEERFRATFEQAAVGVAHVSTDGRLLRVNDKLCEIFGYTREEMLGLTLQDLAYPEDHYADLEQVRWVLAGKTESYSMEKRYLRKDGSLVWANLAVSLVRDLSGDTEYFIGAIEDVTERKRAEEELRKSESSLSAAQRIAHLGNWDYDIGRDEAYWSDELYRIFGFAPQAFVPTYKKFLDLVHPNDRDILRREVRAALYGGHERGHSSVDYRAVRPDGEVRFVSTHYQVVHDASKRPVRLIGTIHDVTERKEAEEKIRRLNEELEQRVRQRTAQLEEANRELESFSYSVSHDLRAPIRHIGGFTQMLQQRAGPSLDEISLRYLNTIVQSTDRAGELIDALLSFSRTSRAEMRPTVVDMNRLVREALEDLRFETDGRSIDLKIEALPEVRGDPRMLRLVLQNLLSNALKYARPRERAVIEVGSTIGEGEAVFFVRDNGVGFDEAYADKLFGVFQRLHRAEEFEGTGIGLATVWRIVQRHGGRVWAEGCVGEGATFYFSLPLPHEPGNEL
jgi:PAS domain S-box-containing protein